LFAVLPSTILLSQNNVFRIDDRLYPIYQRAYSNRASAKGIAAADTLKRLSIAYGDKKAECLAYTIYLQNASIKQDENEIVRTADDLRRISRRNGYLQYYYFATTTHITYLLNHGKSMQAMQENSLLEQEAVKENSHYGILTCLKNMAKIQTSRGNQTMAYKYNARALEYQLQYAPEQDPTMLYKNISEYRRHCLDYEGAMEYAEKAISTAKTAMTKERAIQQKALILYDQGRNDEFMECYKEWEKLNRVSHDNLYDVSYITMMLNKYVIENKIDSALALSERFPREDSRHLFKSRVYEAIGDYENAYHEYHKNRMIRDSLVDAMQASDIAEMNTQMGNQILKNMLKDKEDEAMRLKLLHAQQEAEMEQQRAANEHLKVTNQQLELDKLRSAKDLEHLNSERQRILLQTELKDAKYHDRIVTITAVTALIILIGVFLTLMHHRNMLRRIKKQNVMLKVARDQANSANNMKTAFIHNMSHEIRTPLNAIVGFSQILAMPDMDIPEKDAQEYAGLILSNSEMLTSLVNELLDLAELESGKYTVRHDPVLCNMICLDAISTVFQERETDGAVAVNFVTDVPDDYMLYTDENRVTQVLVNYLTNAKKHTTEGSIELSCSLKENPGRITFAVTDTGCGIAPENVGKLFHSFEKIDNFEQGFGLGLYICANIAEKMEGEVRLDTTYKSGARFLFILPNVKEI
jgi:signal transduction histidine kinase